MLGRIKNNLHKMRDERPLVFECDKLCHYGFCREWFIKSWGIPDYDAC